MASTSTYWRPNRYNRRPVPPPFVPTPPSAEYLALSEVPSTRLSEDDQPLPRKLLVLDLNGTLVLRSPRAYNTPRTVMARPYAKTFRKYVFREGSHLDVMVWSSAQPHSVDSMLDVFFESDRTRLAGVWARDTLGLAAENYSQKVQTIKDLNIVWNAPAGLPPPVKITPPPPMAVLTDDPTSLPGYDPKKPAPEVKAMIYTSTQLIPKLEKGNAEDNQDRGKYWAVPEVRPDDPIPGLGSALPESTTATPVPASPSGIYSALNTLLLDDSALKAHLQPHNHLTLPEYTADLRTRDLRRRDALDELLRVGETSAIIEGIELEEGDVAQDSSAAGDPVYSQPNYKYLRAAPFDKTLIAVIGVLSAVRFESSLIGWMRAGGLRPGAEEMARVAALADKADGKPAKIQISGEQVDETAGLPVDAVAGLSGGPEERLQAKRSSSHLSDEERGSPKRPCPDSNVPEEAVAQAGAVDGNNTMTDVSTLGETDALSTSVPPTVDAPPVEQANREIAPPIPANVTSETPASTSTPIPGSTTSNPTPSNDLPLTEPSHEVPTDEVLPNSAEHTEQTPQSPSKRKRNRTRQKPIFPATHPLSANDSYPFFADGNADRKLWFQEREVYTYWVRRGLLALRKCGIEPEDGVEGS